MSTLYPSGYGARLVDIDTLFRQHHVDKMHPEFARRLRAWLVSKGGTVGIGGSWRSAGGQPNKPGFAPEGRSFHQSQPFRSGLVVFAAVDLVVRNGDKAHRAPRWSEVPARGSDEAKRWGLHCNISSESWHMQCVEMNGFNTWRLTGRRDPVAGYPLPQQRRTLRLGDSGDDVRHVQATLRNKASQAVTVDGKFGPQTAAAVANLQRFFKLPATNVVDAATWSVIDLLAAKP